MNRFKDLIEKKLTPAEKKKREEIAKAMERDNPGMDMKKKMAIATWQAKKVAQDNLDEISVPLAKKVFKKRADNLVRALDKNDDKAIDDAEKKMYRSGDRLTNKTQRGSQSWHSSTKKTNKRFDAIKSESVELDEISKKKLGDYVKAATMDISSRSSRLGNNYSTKALNKLTSRQMNVHKAIDKMTKIEDVDGAEAPAHYMYKDGKKKLVHNKAEHDDAVIDGWKMKENVNEAADPQMDRVKQLVRLGFMDKKDMTKIVRALTMMKDGKAIPPKERSVLFNMLNELIGMITGDDAIFQKARKAVKEAKEDNEPASPDEGSMAIRQLEFIEYAAEEVVDHIKAGKEFPEWMQNKLTKVHSNMEGLHSSLGDHGDEDKEMKKEAVDLDEISKSLVGRKKLKLSDFKVGMFVQGKGGKVGKITANEPRGDQIVVRWNKGGTAQLSIKGLGLYTKPRLQGLVMAEEVELDEISIDLGKKVAKGRRDQEKMWRTKAQIVKGTARDHAMQQANKADAKATKTDRAVYRKEYGKERKLSWEGVKSADRKPEIYTAPDGKKRIRMVPTDKKVI